MQPNAAVDTFKIGYELLKNRPEMIIGGLGLLYNLNDKWVKPNVKGVASSALIYGAHRLAGGSSSPYYHVAAYCVGGAIGKAISRPFYEGLDWIKNGCKKIWNL